MAFDAVAALDGRVQTDDWVRGIHPLKMGLGPVNREQSPLFGGRAQYAIHKAHAVLERHRGLSRPLRRPSLRSSPGRTDSPRGGDGDLIRQRASLSLYAHSCTLPTDNPE